MMQNKRIHIVHVIHHLVIGGMENGLVNLINRMPKERYRHTVICIEDYSNFSERILVDDTNVIALKRSQIGVWRLRQQLFKLFRSLKPDIVHSRNMSGLDAILPARLAGIKCCIHGEHGRDVDDLHGKHIKFRLLRRFHSPFISHYITVSNELKKYLINDINISYQRVSQILNGVDVEKFTPVKSKNDVESQINDVPAYLIDKNKIVIGAVGRLQKVKNYSLLIKAFARLVDESDCLKNKLSLVIVGDGPERQQLIDLAESLGVTQQTWFAGASANVSQMLQLFDVFVLSSVAEGISNTILEAMATGLPVIATSVGGNVELVRDGETGSLVETDNVDSLVLSLQKICVSEELRKKQSNSARQYAVSEYSLDSMVNRYQTLYEHLLGE